MHTHSSEHTHPEQWAAIFGAVHGEQLGVWCFAQGHLSRGITYNKRCKQSRAVKRSAWDWRRNVKKKAKKKNWYFPEILWLQNLGQPWSFGPQQPSWHISRSLQYNGRMEWRKYMRENVSSTTWRMKRPKLCKMADHFYKYLTCFGTKKYLVNFMN